MEFGIELKIEVWNIKSNYQIKLSTRKMIEKLSKNMIKKVSKTWRTWKKDPIVDKTDPTDPIVVQESDGALLPNQRSR